MAIDSLATFISTFKNDIVPTNDDVWAQRFADWVDARVTGKMSLPGIGGPGLTYTFDKSGFAAQLLADVPPPSNDRPGQVAKIAAAWKANLGVASVAPGSWVGVDTNATRWSAVSSTVIDVASQTAAESKLNELASIPAEPGTADEYPTKFWEAFLLLTITTTGVNSVSPTPGPLVDPARAVA